MRTLGGGKSPSKHAELQLSAANNANVSFSKYISKVYSIVYTISLDLLDVFYFLQEYILYHTP